MQTRRGTHSVSAQVPDRHGRTVDVSPCQSVRALKHLLHMKLAQMPYCLLMVARYMIAKRGYERRTGEQATERRKQRR
jgi:hypothetical protein